MKLSTLRRATFGCMTLALTLSYAPTARGQVLEQVPAESLVVVLVNDIGATSGKIGKLADDLGIAAIVPAATDPLNEFAVTTGFGDAIDRNGSLAIAIVPVADNAADGGISPLVLVPVSDYQKLLGSFPDADTADGITQVTTKDGAKVFMASRGKYAAASPFRQAVAAAVDGGVQVKAPAALKAMTGSDVFVLANMPKLKTALLPLMTDQREKLLDEVEEAYLSNAMGPNFSGDLDVLDDAAGSLNEADQANAMKLAEARQAVPLIRAAADQAFNAAQRFLEDADAAGVAIRFEDNGVHSAILADFAKGSYLGELAAGLKGTDQPLIVGLPTATYLAAGGGVADPAVVTKLLSDLLDPVLAATDSLGAKKQKAITGLVEAAKKQIAATTGSTFGMLAPAGQLGAESIIQIIATSRGDSAVLLEQAKAIFDQQGELMSMLGGMATAGGTMKMTGTTKEVAGVTLHQYKTEVFAADDPMAAQAQQAIAMMYGPEGISGYVGAVDAKTLIQLQGVGEADMEKAIVAAKASDTAVGKMPSLVVSSSQLPETRVAEGYFMLGNFLTTGLNYARQFGFAMPVQIDDDLPPIGWTVSSEGNAIRIDEFVPKALLQNISKAALNVAMGMGGGPRGPGGPGGPGMAPPPRQAMPEPAPMN